MQIHLKETDTLTSLRNRFENLFPYLGLSFYSKQHGMNEISEESLKLNSDLTVKQAGGKEGSINLSGDITVAQLEAQLEKSCNLNVQVMKKVGDNWLQTTTTDDWTLSEQNNTAKERSN